MQADADRAAGFADVDQVAPLGDVDVPTVGEPSGRGPDVVHQGAPAGWPGSPGCVGRADRGVLGALAQQPQDDRLKILGGRLIRHNPRR